MGQGQQKWLGCFTKCICFSDHPCRRPNTIYHDDQPDSHPIFLCEHSRSRDSFSVARSAVELVISSTEVLIFALYGNLREKKIYPFPGHPQPALSPTGHSKSESTPPASVQASAAHRAAVAAPSPQSNTIAPGQSPGASSQPSRPQQGQVKLTMGQLMQLTQGPQVRPYFFFLT